MICSRDYNYLSQQQRDIQTETYMPLPINIQRYLDSNSLTVFYLIHKYPTTKRKVIKRVSREGIK